MAPGTSDRARPPVLEATSPTRNRSPRRKAFRLVPLVTTLRRCSPFFTLTPVSGVMLKISNSPPMAVPEGAARTVAPGTSEGRAHG
jgi:hypothetical protein